MSKLTRIFVALGFVATLSWLPPTLSSAQEQGSDLRDLIEEYSADHGSVTFRYDVPMSPRRNERLKTFYTGYQERLHNLDFDSLSQDGKIDYLLFQNKLRYELTAIETDEAKDKAIAPLVPFAPTIIELAEGQEDIRDVEPEMAAEQLQMMVEQIGELSAQVGRNGALQSQFTPTQAIRASRRVQELQRSLRQWYRFYEGYDPLFTWWNKAPYAELDRALDQYAGQLRAQLAGINANDPDKIVGEPIGEQALLHELAYEMIPYTPAELVEIAEAEFAWCDREMLKASNELGFGDDWRAAQEAVKRMHVEPGEQPAMIRDLAFEAVDFLEQRDLVTIPPLCKEAWRMEMMSPERQKISPYFLGGRTIIVSFPTDEMSHPDKLMSMRGNNVHFSRATVQHELIPGHHLQGYMTKRHRPYRGIFRTPFWIEGWALYWEMQLWDLDFPRSAEDRIGMLFWRKHRCARIIFSLNYQLERWSPEECIDFLVERVGHERNNATAEVRRSIMGGYGPLYQAAYMLGGLQIRSMYGQLVGEGKMTPRQFHDAILHQNAIPIEMVRARLANLPLSPDYQPKWRFYDP